MRDLFGDLDADKEKSRKRAAEQKLVENAPADLCTRSEDLRVVNALLNANQLSIGVDNSSGTRKNMVKQPMTVGYELENIGTENIEYTQRVYSLRDDGKYDFDEVEKILHPGERVYLTKRDTAYLVGQTKFGFTISNGYFTGPKQYSDELGIEKYLESRYFVRGTNECGSDRAAIQINNPENIQELQEKFIPVFGYLLNKPKKVRGASSYTRCEKQSMELALAIEREKARKAAEKEKAALGNSETTKSAKASKKPTFHLSKQTQTISNSPVGSLSVGTGSLSESTGSSSKATKSLTEGTSSEATEKASEVTIKKSVTPYFDNSFDQPIGSVAPNDENGDL